MLLALVLSCILAAKFFGQPSWKRNIEIARWSLQLDVFNAPGDMFDQIGQTAIQECNKAPTEFDKAQILYYAILIHDAGNVHESEELYEAVHNEHCQNQLSTLIRALPKSYWRRLSAAKADELMNFAGREDKGK